jgi:hypothetical protein
VGETTHRYGRTRRACRFFAVNDVAEGGTEAGVCGCRRTADCSRRSRPSHYHHAPTKPQDDADRDKTPKRHRCPTPHAIILRRFAWFE